VCKTPIRCEYTISLYQDEHGNDDYLCSGLMDLSETNAGAFPEEDVQFSHFVRFMIHATDNDEYICNSCCFGQCIFNSNNFPRNHEFVISIPHFNIRLVIRSHVRLIPIQIVRAFLDDIGLSLCDIQVNGVNLKDFKYNLPESTLTVMCTGLRYVNWNKLMHAINGNILPMWCNTLLFVPVINFYCYIVPFSVKLWNKMMHALNGNVESEKTINTEFEADLDFPASFSPIDNRSPLPSPPQSTKSICSPRRPKLPSNVFMDPDDPDTGEFYDIEKPIESGRKLSNRSTGNDRPAPRRGNKNPRNERKPAPAQPNRAEKRVQRAKNWKNNNQDTKSKDGQNHNPKKFQPRRGSSRPVDIKTLQMQEAAVVQTPVIIASNVVESSFNLPIAPEPEKVPVIPVIPPEVEVKKDIKKTVEKPKSTPKYQMQSKYSYSYTKDGMVTRFTSWIPSLLNSVMEIGKTCSFKDDILGWFNCGLNSLICAKRRDIHEWIGKLMAKFISQKTFIWKFNDKLGFLLGLIGTAHEVFTMLYFARLMFHMFCRFIVPYIKLTKFKTHTSTIVNDNELVPIDPRIDNRLETSKSFVATLDEEYIKFVERVDDCVRVSIDCSFGNVVDVIIAGDTHQSSILTASKEMVMNICQPKSLSMGNSVDGVTERVLTSSSNCQYIYSDKSRIFIDDISNNSTRLATTIALSHRCNTMDTDFLNEVFREGDALQLVSIPQSCQYCHLNLKQVNNYLIDGCCMAIGLLKLILNLVMSPMSLCILILGLMLFMTKQSVRLWQRLYSLI